MKNLWKASALLGVAALAACAEKPRSEPAYAPAVVAQQPEVPDSVRIRESVLRQAAERTGIAGEWEVKKVYLDGSKVPLCNCKHGDYLIAISPGDTARAFFSQRGEYLSSITTVASDDTARTRRLASPKESTDRVQKRVGGKWMFDHDRETIADTVFKIYQGEDSRFEELGRPLFAVSADGSLRSVGPYNGIHGGDSSHELEDQKGNVRIGQYFEVNTDVEVDGKIVERRGVYFNQPKGLKPYSDVSENASYMPATKNFRVPPAEKHQVGGNLRVVDSAYYGGSKKN